MTTQARLIAQKQAEACVRKIRDGLPLPTSNREAEHYQTRLGILDRVLQELRAQAEAAQPEGEKGEWTSHDGKIIADLEAMAANRDNGFWPSALAIGALRLIRSHQAQAVEGREEMKSISELISEAADALKFLATNARPTGGEDRYNSIHLEMMALSLKAASLIVRMNATPPAQQEALAPVGRPIAIGERLWLWKNFVDGKPEYWAFGNPYPAYASGDPMTLGEPCGYALVRPSTNARPDASEADVLAVIERSTPSPQAVPEGFVLVPTIPTPAMLDSGAAHYNFARKTYWPDGQLVGSIYDAMLAAAPKDQQP